MEFIYRLGGEVRALTVERRGDHYRMTVDGRDHEAIVRRVFGPAMDLVLDGREVTVLVGRDGQRRVVRLEEDDPVALERAGRERAGARPPLPAVEAEAELTAGMDGRVAAVLVREGDPVETGATLLILEAMKMEMRVVAPRAGRVRALACRVGEVVERGRVLVKVEAEPAAAG